MSSRLIPKSPPIREHCHVCASSDDDLSSSDDHSDIDYHDENDYSDPLLEKVNDQILEDILIDLKARKAVSRFNQERLYEFRAYLTKSIQYQIKALFEFQVRIAAFKARLNEAKLEKSRVNLTSWEKVDKKVASLPAGSSFGELALLASRGEGRRAATIVAEKQCFLGVITKEDFDKSLNKIMTL